MVLSPQEQASQKSCHPPIMACLIGSKYSTSASPYQCTCFIDIPLIKTYPHLWWRLPSGAHIRTTLSGQNPLCLYVFAAQNLVFVLHAHFGWLNPHVSCSQPPHFSHFCGQNPHVCSSAMLSPSLPHVISEIIHLFQVKILQNPMKSCQLIRWFGM